jgi:hypothetical protein
MFAKPALHPAESDPILLALARAPMGAPESEEEKRMVAAAMADPRFVRGADVEQMLGELARTGT